MSEWVSGNITQKSILGTSYCEYIYNWNFHLAKYTLSIIFCKPSYPGWRCLWGSSLPFPRRRPSQSESSALPAEWLLLTGTGLPRRWWKIWWCSNVTCDFSETCLQSEKPYFVFDWLTFIFQYKCTYLVKLPLNWEKWYKLQQHLDLKSFSFWFLSRGIIIIRETLFDANRSAVLLSLGMDLCPFLLKIMLNTFLSF